jgi:L-aminopeptidase/D-esterase-like protein
MTQRSRSGFRYVLLLIIVGFILISITPALGQSKQRARDLGIPFEGTPGPLNAITDVAGIEVGHTTLISGNGRLAVGKGPVRTGVTAILPRGKRSFDPIDSLFAATVQATEEAVTNAMLAAETITGVDDVKAYALPHDRLREILRKYNRLAPTAGAKN